MKIFYVRICSLILLLVLVGTATEVCAAGYFRDTVSYVCGASRSHVYLDKEVGIDNLDVNQGYWLLIHSDQYATVNPDDLSSITQPMVIDTVSNAFGLVGRPYGAYDLIFVSTQNQQCGINVDGMAHLRLNILPPSEHFYIGQVCVSNGTIILNNVLEELMPSFEEGRDEIVWTHYKLNDANDLVEANDGLNTSTGELSLDKYLGTEVTINFSLTRQIDGHTINNCSDGSITLEVVDSVEPQGTINSVPFCIESLPDTVSLNQLLGMGFPSSSTDAWSSSDGVSIVGSKVPLKSAVKKYITDNSARPTQFEFKLTRTIDASKCITQGEETLIIKFVDSDFRMPSDIPLSDVCQYADPYINLYEKMGLALPSNAGTWKVEPAIDPAFFSDGRLVTIGLQEGEYKFTYIIDETIDTTLACAIGIDTVRLNFKFNEDNGLKGTSIQVCEDNADNINLYSLLMNRNYTTHLDDGYWAEVNNKDVVLEKLTSAQASNVDLSGKPNNTYMYRFTDTTESFCGDSVALVYVTKTRNVAVSSRTISMCHLFNTADTFSLTAFAGLAGVCGTWSWEDVDGAGSVIKADGTPATNGSAQNADGLFFLANDEYSTNPPAGEEYKQYKFTFKVGPDCDGCGLKKDQEIPFYVNITSNMIDGLP
ncbi:MAG: hypothetical protein ACK5MG_03780 [Bacteroidales bacterium]